MIAPHTPGPWSLDQNDQRDEAQVIMADKLGIEIADVFAGDRPGELEANARLIAAAPELLAALKRIERWFDTDDEILAAMDAATLADHNRQLSLIRAAIAKARGAA